MKKSLILLCALISTITICKPMMRALTCDLDSTLESTQRYALCVFSYPELAGYVGRYASYIDPIKKRLIAIAPAWGVGAAAGFTFNVLPTETKTLLKTNLVGALTLLSLGGTIKVIGGEDITDALKKLHGSSQGDIAMAVAAGYIAGGLYGRFTNKTCRFAGTTIKDGAYYGYQTAKYIGQFSWNALVAAITAIKRKMNQPEQPIRDERYGVEVTK